MEKFKLIPFEPTREAIDIDHSNIINEMVRIDRDCEERLIRQVLESYLGREATIEDAKKTTRYYKQFSMNEYSLSYDGVLLGNVKVTTTSNQEKREIRTGYEFNPHK